MRQQRIEKAISIIGKLELDAGLIFSPEAQFYFLGHDSFAGVNTPQALILSPHLLRPVMVIWSADAPMLPGGAAGLTLRKYEFGIDSPASAIAEALHRFVGQDPVIASLSFGATRRFRLKHRTEPGNSLTLELPPGSCLVMAGALQHHWRHALPKTRRAVGPRVNLTFRLIRR